MSDNGQYVSLDPKLVQRAKDIAARVSVQAYMETIQTELRKALLEANGGDEESVRESMIILTGVHIHEAVAMDESGNAVLIRARWEVSKNGDDIADAVARSRHEGRS